MVSPLTDPPVQSWQTPDEREGEEMRRVVKESGDVKPITREEEEEEEEEEGGERGCDEDLKRFSV